MREANLSFSMDVVEDIADDFENYEDDTHLGYTAEVFDEVLTKEEEPTRFQRPNPFNKLLPYSDVLEVEADAMFADIKANLGRCVMQRDIKIGAVAWTKMLHKYIILYDMRFTKEDHIALIKLLYELTTIPNLETGLIVSFAYRLFLLLKKDHLISPDELELPWKPLYKLYWDFENLKSKLIKLDRLHPMTKSIVKAVIRLAKIYFPTSATEEILDEIKPMLSPNNHSIMVVTKTMEIFLPTCTLPKHHSKSFELWLHEFMNMWEDHNAVTLSWSKSLTILTAKLALHNVGYINWEPYLPIMFNRLVHLSSLPISYKNISNDRHYRDWLGHGGMWIAAVLGPDSKAQNYLDKFLKLIETHFHPANHSPNFVKYASFISSLVHCFTTRVNRERYQQVNKTWKPRIPDSHKLRDVDIDAFVNSLMPIVLQCIFHTQRPESFGNAVQNLANLRPNVVIPRILEKVFPSIGDDIEPHKFHHAMVNLIDVARPMILGSRVANPEYAYVEGPQQVLPILFSALSGIDPNDFIKYMYAFACIGLYATMIPIVDCSGCTAPDLTEDERLVCEQTSKFEDFVLQFMDKIFSWIDSSRLQPTRLENQVKDNTKSRLENACESALSNVMINLLRSMSKPIFMSALNKLRNYVMEYELEIQVAGPLVAVICRMFSSTHAKETLNALMPFLVDKVLEILGDGDDVIKAEAVDHQLLYPLLLLKSLSFVHCSVMMIHIDSFLKVVDRVIKMKNREAQTLGSQIMANCAQSLGSVSIYACDVDYENKNHCYPRDWGVSGKIYDTKLLSEMPGEREFEALKGIFHRYFDYALRIINGFIETGDSSLKMELQGALRVLVNLFEGCSNALPKIQGPPTLIEPYVNEIKAFDPYVGWNQDWIITMPDGSNIRNYMVDVIEKLQKVMLEKIEDDTKCFVLLSMFWENLLTDCLDTPLDTSSTFCTNYYIKKKKVESTMTGSRAWFPRLVLTRAQDQHGLRTLGPTMTFTETHRRVLMNLMDLNCSRYSKVRQKTQSIIEGAVMFFPQAPLVILPRVIDVLKSDPDENHEAFKGVLHLMVRRIAANDRLINCQNWNYLKQLWPALVGSASSERISINALKNKASMAVLTESHSFNVRTEIPDDCVEVARRLWDCGKPPSLPPATRDEVRAGLDRSLRRNDANQADYDELADSLLKDTASKNWRQRLMAIQFLTRMMQKGARLPDAATLTLVSNCISDSVMERKQCLRTAVFVLWQLKLRHPRLRHPVPKLGPGPIRPGVRPDNLWLQYDYEKRPLDAAAWDEPRYINSESIGYWAWPKEYYETAAPWSARPVDKPASKLERDIEAFFADEANLERLIKFWSLEEKKVHERGNYEFAFLIRGLFRNYGDNLLDAVLKHAERLVEIKQEGPQRCVANIVSGAIMGSKYWSYDMTVRMWSRLLPILSQGIDKQDETVKIDWLETIALAMRNRDPNRMHWLLEFLLERAKLGRKETSFLESMRLSYFQLAMSSQIWRTASLEHRALELIERRIEESPLKTVRDKFPLLLQTIFSTERRKDGSVLDVFPDPDAFMDKIYPRFLTLLEEVPKAEAEPMEVDGSVDKATNAANAEREKVLRYFLVVCGWLEMLAHGMSHNRMERFYKLLPIMCHLEVNEKDEEVVKICRKAIAVLAKRVLRPAETPVALETIDQVSRSPSYWIRLSSLEFLTVMSTHSISILLSKDEWIYAIEEIVMRLLEDEQPEVRGKARKLLEGLLHFTFLPNQDVLLENLRVKAKTKLPKMRSAPGAKASVEKIEKFKNAVRLRHAGVLGLCAFISANPYHVPDYVPEILGWLSDHLNDPEPIPSAIRKSINEFKRTHCDGWTGLQGLADFLTDEQLSILSDLAVPPAYYA
ncbi:hypothetical protein TKK_0003717 [Trichogramma kaykai]